MWGGGGAGVIAGGAAAVFAAECGGMGLRNWLAAVRDVRSASQMERMTAGSLQQAACVRCGP